MPRRGVLLLAASALLASATGAGAQVYQSTIVLDLPEGTIVTIPSNATVAGTLSVEYVQTGTLCSANVPPSGGPATVTLSVETFESGGRPVDSEEFEVALTPTSLSFAHQCGSERKNASWSAVPHEAVTEETTYTVRFTAQGAQCAEVFLCPTGTIDLVVKVVPSGGSVRSPFFGLTFPTIVEERPDAPASDGGPAATQSGSLAPFAVPIVAILAVAALIAIALLRRGKSAPAPAVAAPAPSPPDAAPTPGMVFLGKYLVERGLGRGAFGSTWLATHTSLARRAVIKQLHPEWAVVEEARERFQREARILAGLDHPNVTRVHDVEQVGPAWYLVMEYVDGGSLEDRLREGPLPLVEASHVTAQILAGLSYIHSRGVLHRDIKPSNILLTSDGVAKIADFGVARSGESDSLLTTEGASPPGTLLYMAPEQVRGDRGDARSDLYAVAAMQYRLLTGRFYLDVDEHDVFELRQAIPTAAPTLPLPGFGPALNRWLLRGLEKKPADRFRSADEMWRALLEAQVEDASPTS